MGGSSNEQVSSDGHQMLLVGGGAGVPCLMSWGGLYSEVQCIMGNGDPPAPVNSENIPLP